MLNRHRRYLAPLIWAILSLPLLVMLLAPDPTTIDHREARILTPWPSLSDGKSSWQRLPDRIDAYLADHFGLRSLLLRGETLVAQRLLRNGNDNVLIGQGGWLFYRPGTVLQQGAGLLVRVSTVKETADTLARVDRSLKARGIRFLVAVPPSSQTIQDADLPKWARNAGRTTEYDLLLRELRARGVEAIDLRPALRAAAEHETVYNRYDTHWNKLGALEAFNVVADAAGHPDWRLDPTDTLVPAQRGGGDLARMLGIDDLVGEPVPALRNPRPEFVVGDSGQQTPFVLTADHAGPTLLVVGDSFTMSFFPPMVLANAGRFAWIHHRGCTLDWRWVESVGADEVWWMPTERILLCQPGAAPAGLEPEPSPLPSAALSPPGGPPAPRRRRATASGPRSRSRARS